MASPFRSVDRATPYLMPPSLQEWLPEDHLARFVVETVGQLDTSALEKAYDRRGSQAYHPKMLLALLFYGYATGTFSSRRIERGTYDSVAFRYISANEHPDHDTICTFRRRFLASLQDLFVQILEIAHQMDLLNVGDIALDGTKVKANASKHKALSWKHACQLEEQLEEEVRELLEAAETADEEELPDKLSVPEEIARREERIERIQQAKERIQARAAERYEAEQTEYEERMAQRKEKEQQMGRKMPGPKPKPPEPGPRPKDQVNLTDEQSRIMPTSDNGFQQAYNLQASVSMEDHLIVGGHLTQAPNDKQQLTPALAGLSELATLPEHVGSPDRLSADSGYFSEDNVTACEDEGITPFIATGRQVHNQRWQERFEEAGSPPEEDTGVEAMTHRLETEEGKAFYARRKGTVEPIFGIIKHVMGFRQFLLRGLEKVKGEWALLRCAYNLKRLHALQG